MVEIIAEVAVTVAGPNVTPVTRPPLTVTPAVELHVTMEVMFAVVPSEYFPVAVSCRAIPTPVLKVAGVKLIETKLAGGGGGGELEPPPPPQALSNPLTSPQISALVRRDARMFRSP